MLTLPPTVRIFVATGATDLRRSVDGLSATLASKILGVDVKPGGSQ